MKAIILAAGKWTRLEPITLETPKAMVEVFGKNLLEHNLEKLLPYVDEFIIVVKYKAEVIKNHFWNEFQWIPIRYHNQWEKKWTAGALEWLEISGDCYIIAADTIYRQADIDAIANVPWYAALCQRVEHPEKYGIFQIDDAKNIVSVVEKPIEFTSDLASLFYLKVNSDLITYCKQVQVSQRWEYELTDALNIFFTKHQVRALQIQYPFVDITSVTDLEEANTLIKPELWKTQYLENIGDYEIHLGIPQTWIKEIIGYSLDETDIALREWTSDWKKRFISEENLTSWYEDTDRFAFTLLSKDWVIAGLWWWRPAKSPVITKIINVDLYNTLIENIEYTHTWAIRIYPFARGDRLASPFMKFCSQYYKSLFDNIHMCVDIDEQNIPSQKAFEKIWFEKVGYGKNINNAPESGKQRFVYLKTY